jgi:hypothetical protein
MRVMSAEVQVIVNEETFEEFFDPNAVTIDQTPVRDDGPARFEYEVIEPCPRTADDQEPSTRRRGVDG